MGFGDAQGRDNVVGNVRYTVTIDLSCILGIVHIEVVT
jgi:hypothetical protein